MKIDPTKRPEMDPKIHIGLRSIFFQLREELDLLNEIKKHVTSD